MKMIAALLVSSVFGVAAAQTSPPASHSPAAMMRSDAKRDAAVERHIAELHAKLNITGAEETQWKEVAETMRENAKDLDLSIDKRVAAGSTASAIDDLNSYAEIAQTHANGVKKLAVAFSSLYSVMSDDQKKQADEVFSHRNHAAGKVASR